MKNLNDIKKSLMIAAQELSTKVSNAISPIDTVSMALSAVVLENYVHVLKNVPEFDDELYAILKRTLRPIVFKCDAADPDAVEFVKTLMQMANETGGNH